MQLQAKQNYSPAEYLALEEASEFRSEYLDGQIVPMAGGSPEHNRIIGNVYRCLNDGADQGAVDAQVFFSDMRVWIPKTRTYTYPDALAVVGPLQMLENRNDTLMNPRLLVEVLSTSTKDYDRGEKFLFYRSIPSFAEYLLVDQYAIHVEHHVKNERGQWVLTEYDDRQAIVQLESLACELSLEMIYRKIAV